MTRTTLKLVMLAASMGTKDVAALWMGTAGHPGGLDAGVFLQVAAEARDPFGHGGPFGHRGNRVRTHGTRRAHGTLIGAFENAVTKVEHGVESLLHSDDAKAVVHEVAQNMTKVVIHSLAVAGCGKAKAKYEELKSEAIADTIKEDVIDEVLKKIDTDATGKDDKDLEKSLEDGFQEKFKELDAKLKDEQKMKSQASKEKDLKSVRIHQGVIERVAATIKLVEEKKRQTTIIEVKEKFKEKAEKLSVDQERNKKKVKRKLGNLGKLPKLPGMLEKPVESKEQGPTKDKKKKVYESIENIKVSGMPKTAKIKQKDSEDQTSNMVPGTEVDLNHKEIPEDIEDDEPDYEDDFHAEEKETPIAEISTDTKDYVARKLAFSLTIEEMKFREDTLTNRKSAANTQKKQNMISPAEKELAYLLNWQKKCMEQKEKGENGTCQQTDDAKPRFRCEYVRNAVKPTCADTLAVDCFDTTGQMDQTGWKDACVAIRFTDLAKAKVQAA